MSKIRLVWVGAFYHPKVVNRNPGVQKPDDGRKLLVNFVGFLIVGDNRVHMDDDLAVKLLFQVPFGIVYGVMDL